MILRNWQQKIIDDYPSIIKQNKRFILKAPTGAGKTILASEIVEPVSYTHLTLPTNREV